MEAYGGSPLEMVPVGIKDMTVAIVEQKLLESVGPRRVGLYQITTLAAAFWGGKSGTTAYWWGVWRLDHQRSPTLGGLQGTDVGAPHWPQKNPWGQTGSRGGDMAAYDGEVCVGGDGGGGQGDLLDGAAMWWIGGRD